MKVPLGPSFSLELDFAPGDSLRGAQILFTDYVARRTVVTHTVLPVSARWELLYQLRLSVKSDIYCRVLVASAKARQ